jgi:hypothetical protein
LPVVLFSSPILLRPDGATAVDSLDASLRPEGRIQALGQLTEVVGCVRKVVVLLSEPVVLPAHCLERFFTHGERITSRLVMVRHVRSIS